jgi:hypothetical protein
MHWVWIIWKEGYLHYPFLLYPYSEDQLWLANRNLIIVMGLIHQELLQTGIQYVQTCTLTHDTLFWHVIVTQTKEFSLLFYVKDTVRISPIFQVRKLVALWPAIMEGNGI